MSDKEFPSAFTEFINGLNIDDFDGKKNSQSTNVIKEELDSSQATWVVNEVEKDGIKKSEIQNGNILIYYDRLSAPDTARLNWKVGDLPSHLTPRNEGSAIHKLEQLLFQRLPLAMGYASTGETESMGRFLRASTAAFGRTGLDKPKEYDCAKPGDFYNFAADFMRLPSDSHPLSLRIRCRRNVAFAAQVMYNLRLDYHDIDPRAGEMTLFVPLASSESTNRLTAELMQFAIDTHEKRFALADTKQAAHDLSGIVVNLARRK